MLEIKKTVCFMLTTFLMLITDPRLNAGFYINLRKSPVGTTIMTF